MKKIYLSFICLSFLTSFWTTKTVAQATTASPPPEAALGTWQCVRGSERMQGTQYMKGSFYNQPVAKWKGNLNTTKGGCEGEPVIGDVNGDKNNDVVVTTTNGHILAFDGASGAPLWDVAAVAGQTSAMIGDANNDGNPDVVVTRDKVYLLDGSNGNIIWSFTPVITGAGQINTSPNMGDLDHDGNNEVVVIVQDAVYALNGLNGSQKWKYATGNPISGRSNGSSPAIGDLNGDGILDVVAVLQNGSGLPGSLVALNGNDGSVIWTKSVDKSPTGLGAKVPAIGDLNGDCKMEVVYNKSALNGIDGSTIWGTPTANGGSAWNIIADLNNDCSVEVITTCGVLKGADGTTVWSLSSCINDGWYSPAPKVGDFDPNSPGMEIIKGQSYQMKDSNNISVPVANPLPMVMYNGYTGVVLWSYDIATLLHHTSEGISIGDVDNDGCVEIVVAPDCCNGDPTLLVLDDDGSSTNCGLLASISQVDFLPSDTTGCGCIYFRDFSAPCTSTWNWSFPGATPSSSAVQNPGSVCYSSNGTYSVTMSANLNGCTIDTITHVVTISCSLALPPVAHLQSSDSAFCENDCISFTDLSVNSPTSWLWTFAGGTPSSSTDQNPPFVCYQTSGTYDVILIAGNSAGTDTVRASSLIDVNAAPPAPNLVLMSYDSLVCLGSYSSYQWYDSSALIPGATYSYLIINHSGNYNIHVTGSNGCSVAGGINIVLGIQNYSAAFGFISIYPNPATNELNIEGNWEGSNVLVSVFDAVGRRVEEESIRTNNQIIINVKNLAKGIYTLQIAGDKGTWTGVFVKD